MSATVARILYIEDNAMNWRLVQRLLSKAGYEMHWAEDGLRGCEMAAALRPALVLLDINLPGLSGFEVATKLRKDPDLKDTLIVALTAKTLSRDKETALVTGCDGFISKPIDPFLFVEQVEAYLRGRRDVLEKAREGPALRQFSQQVVEHLEAQLQEAKEGNRKLLEAQSQLEQRSQHLTRLLALSREIILLRDTREIEIRVLEELCQELGLNRVTAYRLDASCAYFHGRVWSGLVGRETEVLSADHPLVSWVQSLDHFGVVFGAELRQSPAWEPGVQLGLWGPRSQGLIRPLRGRSANGDLWGFLAADRETGAYLPVEVELADLHAGILRVSLENAELITHQDDTSRALGDSYEGLESAHEALKEAQRALQAQNQHSALGSLFLTVAERIRIPVQVLKKESAIMSAFLDRSDLFSGTDQVDCRRAMDQIGLSVSEVDDLVNSVLRRVGQSESNRPEWIHLHTLLSQELELMRAGKSLPVDLSVQMNLQATRDLLFGVHEDFSQVLGHMVAHALRGNPSHLIVRTWGGKGHFRLELEDDGEAIPVDRLASAFEPFLNLHDGSAPGGRIPGPGLPASAQLMQAYGGKVEILPAAQGSLLRLSLPLV